jgi:hypothetical protein
MVSLTKLPFITWIIGPVACIHLQPLLAAGLPLITWIIGPVASIHLQLVLAAGLPFITWIIGPVACIHLQPLLAAGLPLTTWIIGPVTFNTSPELFAVNIFLDMLTTSINNAHMKNHQHSRNNFSTIFGSASILQILGVKYELQWTLRHYYLVIGDCLLAGFKTVKVKPAF